MLASARSRRKQDQVPFLKQVEVLRRFVFEVAVDVKFSSKVPHTILLWSLLFDEMLRQ